MATTPGVGIPQKYVFPGQYDGLQRSVQPYEMVTWDLWDASFAHCAYSNNPQPPTTEAKHVRWNREVRTDGTGPLFMTDVALEHHNSAGDRRKVAWLLEPAVLQEHRYAWVRANFAAYHAVLSHDVDAMSHLPNFLWVPFGGCWIAKDRWWDGDEATLPKSGLNIVASSKNTTQGHMLRHVCVDAMRKAGTPVTVFGRDGYGTFEHKHQVMGTKYQVVIENESRNGYFTEKLIDCLVCGVVPIYWGCPDLAKYGFDEFGIVRFSSADDLMERVLPGLAGAAVNVEALRTNAMNARRFLLAEDYIYEKYRDIL